MKWLDNSAQQKPFVLRLYDNSPENSPFLTFNPLKAIPPEFHKGNQAVPRVQQHYPCNLKRNCFRFSDKPDWNPAWEEWHCCSEPLRIYFEDYRRLLKSCFALMFPTTAIPQEFNKGSQVALRFHQHYPC